MSVLIGDKETAINEILQMIDSPDNDRFVEDVHDLQTRFSLTWDDVEDFKRHRVVEIEF